MTDASSYDHVDLGPMGVLYKLRLLFSTSASPAFLGGYSHCSKFYPNERSFSLITDERDLQSRVMTVTLNE
jgi:hypothetical protein